MAIVLREVVLDPWVGYIKSNKKMSGDPTQVSYQIQQKLRGHPNRVLDQIQQKKNRQEPYLVHFILSGCLPAWKYNQVTHKVGDLENFINTISLWSF